MLYQSDQSATAVQFSPFVQGRLALSTAQNFGIVGNGRVTVLQAGQAGFSVVAAYDTADGALPCRSACVLLRETLASSC